MQAPFDPDRPVVELQRLRTMMLIRRFEQRTFLEYCKPSFRGPNNESVFRIGGFTSLSDGQEALPVGVASAYRHGVDSLANSYRCHGYSLALGMTPRAAMAELYGRETGCSKGRGGSMHFFDAARGNLGGWYTAGAQVPLGAGAAFAAWYRGTGSVAFIIFGDGAVNQGVVHETINLAALYKLPAVFLLEDNGIAMGTRVERHSAEPDLARRAGGYGLPVAAFDGNDLDEVIAHVSAAADRARAGGGPSYLVARTFRFRGFSMSDSMRYRTKEETDRAVARDPITLCAEKLRRRGLLDDDVEAQLQSEVAAYVDAGIAAAEADPHPEVRDRFANVLAETYPLQK